MQPCTTGGKDGDLGTPLTLYHTAKERNDSYLLCVLRSLFGKLKPADHAFKFIKGLHPE